MVGSCFWISAACSLIVSCVLGPAIIGLLDFMAYDKDISFLNDSCTLLDIPTPTEDLSALGDGHCAFAGGGDLFSTFSTGSAKQQAGSVWLINATRGSVEKLAIIGERVPPKLILHGIHYSQTTRKLYAVNHNEEWGESVEIFDVVHDGTSFSLHHVTSKKSVLFNNMALNDVVEGVDGEFYVTEWLPFGVPPNGKRSPNASALDKLRSLGTVLFTMFKVPRTRVFRCTLDSECVVASDQRFVGANGITASLDRQTIYVNDAPAQKVYVMRRTQTGALTLVSEFQSLHIIDNFEMMADGLLHAGTIPLPHTCQTVCEESPALSRSRTIAGREVGCGRSPGGLLLIDVADSAGEAKQADKVMHDGSLMSGVSSALMVNPQKALLGSPHSRGTLLCDL
eukprot:TRINITY_DN48908_c0_g1_i1.p1 TRINITY_DN48908_c0_g1~~TRINITY_DN48908_c0_g1_i1.p1  ORF type:complete len:412 (+),score=47.05 TRINITY_DN48908_c0_g1_i1:49-1236(+)